MNYERTSLRDDYDYDDFDDDVGDAVLVCFGGICVRRIRRLTLELGWLSYSRGELMKRRLCNRSRSRLWELLQLLLESFLMCFLLLAMSSLL